MDCRRYTSGDYSQVAEWYSGRDLLPPNPEMFGKIGYMVPGIAAGWLLQTDSTVCILEPFIANPDVPRSERNEALYEIMVKLTHVARGLGYKLIFGFSTSQMMINRAIQLGFDVIERDSTTVFKRLE